MCLSGGIECGLKMEGKCCVIIPKLYNKERDRDFLIDLISNNKLTLSSNDKKLEMKNIKGSKSKETIEIEKIIKEASSKYSYLLKKENIEENNDINNQLCAKAVVVGEKAIETKEVEVKKEKEAPQKVEDNLKNIIDKIFVCSEIL